MNEKSEERLSDIVQISRQYQRSIRVDADIGRVDALSGYICHATAGSVVDVMCEQLSGTNQRCFTWTGPFGGGKSSLAVALASALHPDKNLRAKARQVLHLNSKPAFDIAFPVRKGWLIVPVVGRRGSVVAALHAALRHAEGRSVDGRSKANSQTLIAELLDEAKNRSHDGVLVIVDEMGKFLEASALGAGDDVYFFKSSPKQPPAQRVVWWLWAYCTNHLRSIPLVLGSTPVMIGPRCKAATSICRSSLLVMKS
ncbi:hypothetical protein AAFM48_08310 [Burkholderia pseudomallei]